MNRPLTLRQLELISLIGEGLDYKEIAARLDISIKTVKKISTVIHKKLNMTRKAQVIHYALARGLCRNIYAHEC